MKKIFTLLFSAVAIIGNSQTVVFTDNFESGLGNWSVTGSWGLTTTQSNSPSNSLTDSPGGLYANSTTSYATMLLGADLSNAVSADVSFYAIYDLESSFDYTYLEVSTDNGNTWNLLATFTGDNQLTPWVQYTYSLGGYVGFNWVRLRFKFSSDQGLTEDGIYIDDFVITEYNTDIYPPLILHTAPVFYESNMGSQSLTATLTDVSGVSSSTLYYKVDGGAVSSIAGVNTVGNNYVYVIPSQTPGAWVEYYIKATDNSTSLNSDSTAWLSYIAGNYIKYDNAVVDYVQSAGPSAVSGLDGMAVKISLPAATNLVTALIRNYTDINRPNDSMQVHIWSDGGGFPGTDLITPITIFPEASLSNPHAFTRIDLRPYAAQLASVSGDVYIGYTVPVGEVWTNQTTPAVANRTYTFNGSFWTLAGDDYHFRLITGAYQGSPVADFSYVSLTDPQIAFADLSTNNPTSWLWDFDDNGATSTQQNPTYTFPVNRQYNVCLTATNSIGNSTVCKLIDITGVPPDASFTWTGVNDPQFDFTDTSPDTAISWLWDFGDGQQSTVQNPSHIYSSNGIFPVCLTISTSWGTSNPYCDTVTVAHVGIAENSEENSMLQVYPNPFHQSCRIVSTRAVTSLDVYDAIGKRVVVSYELNGSEILLQGDFGPGYYLVRATFEDGGQSVTRMVAY